MKYTLYIALAEMDVPSGPSVHVLNLLAGFRSAGMKLKLLCPRPGKPVAGLDGHDCVFVPFFGFSPLRLCLFNMLLFFRLLAILLFARPAAICVRDRAGNILPALCAGLFRIPLVIEMNGVLKADFIRPGDLGFAKSLLQRIHLRLRQMQFTRAGGIIFNCPSLMTRYRARFRIKARCGVIAMHVDSGLFRPHDQEECRKALGLAPDSLVIGYVGSFAPTHNFSILKALLMHFNSAGRNAHLLMVGGGPNRQESGLSGDEAGLPPELARKIHITGWVPHDEVPRYINAMSVGTSFFNHFRDNTSPASLKVKEYLACGIPVALNCPDCPDQSLLDGFPPGIHNFVTPEADTIPLPELTAAVTALSDLDETARQNLAAYTDQEFSLLRLAEKTAAFINDLP